MICKTNLNDFKNLLFVSLEEYYIHILVDIGSAVQT